MNAVITKTKDKQNYSRTDLEGVFKGRMPLPESPETPVWRKVKMNFTEKNNLTFFGTKIAVLVSFIVIGLGMGGECRVGALKHAKITL